MANPLAPKGDITLPVLGRTSKKAAYAYGAAALAVVGIAVWRHRRAQSLAASDPNTAAAGATDITDAGTDDGTGGAGYAPGDAYGAASGQYGYGSGAIPGGGNVSSDGSLETTSQHATTNSQWSQYAIDYFQGLGMDPGPISSAIGKYLAGQNVDDAEMGLINQAIATQGLPPQSGTEGFPPAIRHVAGASVTKLAAPQVTMRVAGGIATLSWPAVKNASQYTVHNLTDNGAVNTAGATSYKVAVAHHPNDVYAVTASNAGRGFTGSEKSNSVTIPSGVSTLAAPHLSAKRYGNRVVLSWNKVPHATSYTLRNFTDNQTVTTSGTTHTQTVTGNRSDLFAVEARASGYTTSHWSNETRIPSK